jgi:hypothetical protein
MNLDEDGPRCDAAVRSVDEMTPGESFPDRWRGLSDERRRDSALALVGLIAAVVVVVTIPWVVGVVMIGALQLAAIGLIVYLAVRLALRHR